MENIINYICNGSNEFTPAVVVGLIVFCLVLESISSIAANCLKVGRWSYAWIVIIYHCFRLHYVGLFKMILSIILGITLIWGIGWLFGNGCMHFSFLFSDIIQNHRYFHELWRSENTITQFEEVWIEEYR